MPDARFGRVLYPERASFMYARAVANGSKVCSFCGKEGGRNAQIFAAEFETDGAVAICEECVLTCAKAIDVEQRLSERPQGKARGDAIPDSNRSPAGAAWTPFRVGALSLEWRTESAMIVSVRRADNHERVVSEHFARDTEPTVDDAETVAEDHWGTLHG